MTTNDQFRDVDAHGGRLLRRLPRRGLSTRPSSGHVFAAGRFPSDPGTSACEEFITKLGRNFQVTYGQVNTGGQKVQTAGSNMPTTNSAVGSSWA